MSVSHSESPANGDIEWLEPLVWGLCFACRDGSRVFRAAVDSYVGIWVCPLVRDSKTVYSLIVALCARKSFNLGGLCVLIWVSLCICMSTQIFLVNNAKLLL